MRALSQIFSGLFMGARVCACVDSWLGFDKKQILGMLPGNIYSLPSGNFLDCSSHSPPSVVIPGHVDLWLIDQPSVIDSIHQQSTAFSVSNTVLLEVVA